MSRHLSPRYGQVILVSGYPVLTAVKWSQHWCTICVQYQSSCATKLAGKCEIEHWFSCGADGRAGCGRCTVTWIPNFLGWVDLLTHGAPQARFACQSSAIRHYFLCTLHIVSRLISPRLHHDGRGDNIRDYMHRWVTSQAVYLTYLLVNRPAEARTT